MKVIVLGVHPDDPESGCGGLAANCVKAGHEVVFIYATAYREGRKFFGRPEKAVRTEEALAACEVIGVRGYVWDYPHGDIHVNQKNIAEFKVHILKEEANTVITHWPVDTHFDHKCVGAIVLSVFLDGDANFDLYFFEVLTGKQSLCFCPTHYVDISEVAEIKHQALLCHKSQNGEAVWQAHELMHRTRGNECGVQRAEAYIKLDRGKTARNLLPCF